MPAPSLSTALEKLHGGWSGFNSPASVADLRRLAAAFPRAAAADLLALYRDHDGTARRPAREEGRLAARLMPADEALLTTTELEPIVRSTAPAPALWAWTDDNSNYAGVFTSGPLEGMIVVLNHDEPNLCPRFQSVGSFLHSMLASADSEEPASDLPSVPCDLPAHEDDPADVDRFRTFSLEMLDRYRAAKTKDERRIYASVVLSLLPVAETGRATEFLRDDDIWTPETAATLLAIRGFTAAIPELEWLAREGHPNGDRAAMRALFAFDTVEAQEAIRRLDELVSGQKRSAFDLWKRVHARNRTAR